MYRDILAAFGFAFVVMLFMSITAILFDKMSCQSKAYKMELNSTWGVFQGCMFETDDGRWRQMPQHRINEDF